MAGKKAYVEFCEDVLSRLEVFLKRYELSDDPYAKEQLKSLGDSLDVKLGTDLKGVLVELREVLALVKTMTSREEEGFTSAAPEGKTLPEMEEFMKDEKLVELLQKPEVAQALREMVDDPTSAERHKNNPEVAEAVERLFGKAGLDNPLENGYGDPNRPWPKAEKSSGE